MKGALTNTGTPAVCPTCLSYSVSNIDWGQEDCSWTDSQVGRNLERWERSRGAVFSCDSTWRENELSSCPQWGDLLTFKRPGVRSPGRGGNLRRVWGLRVSNELGGALSHQAAPTQTHTYINTHTTLSPPTPSRPTKNKHVPTDLTDLPVCEWQRVKTYTYTQITAASWLYLYGCSSRRAMHQ